MLCIFKWGKYTKKVKCDIVTYEYLYIQKSVSNHYSVFTLIHYTPTFVQLWIFGCACDLTIYHFMSLLRLIINIFGR